MAWSFSVSRRVSAMISARVSSTTLRVFEYGALNTATPCAEAPARSIWSVPMQNAPTASSSGAPASTASVTRVLDRIPSSATPGSAAARSLSPRADRCWTTSSPASSSGRTASGWMFSSSSAFTGPGYRTPHSPRSGGFEASSLGPQPGGGPGPGSHGGWNRCQQGARRHQDGSAQHDYQRRHHCHRHDTERPGEAPPRRAPRQQPQRAAHHHRDGQREGGLPGDDGPDLAPGHAERLQQGEFGAPPPYGTQHGKRQ